jgi:hypothetical protein
VRRRRPTSARPRGRAGPLDLLALLHVQPAQQVEQPGDVLLLVVGDPLDDLLGARVREREGLGLVAVDRLELGGQVLAQRLQVRVELGQPHDG